MRTLIISALVLTVSSACAQNAEADFAPAADVYYAEAHAQFGAFVPGFAAAVVRGDETVYARGFGYADREAGLEATADTPFYLASVTKPFTSLLITLLAQEGALSLDDTLADLFPDLAFAPAIRPGEVTVRHLLLHTSGLRNDPIVFRTAQTGTPSSCVGSLAKPRSTRTLRSGRMNTHTAAPSS